MESISKSIFLKWSGNGAHVHIHHAFSPEFLREINLLDAAYALVQYTNNKLRSRYLEIAKRDGALELKVENEMDLQTVLTCTLSFQRSRNLVAVCLPLNMVSDFAPEWASPEHYHHCNNWDRFEKGEAVQLAEKALRIEGAYPLRLPGPSQRRKKSTVKLMTRHSRKESEANFVSLQSNFGNAFVSRIARYRFTKHCSEHS